MIEFRAREDWTASRVSLWITVLEKPNVGGSLFFDLSPEIAERLAQDLLTAVKRYRDLEAAVEKDLKPKLKEGMRIRRVSEGAEATGEIVEVTSVDWLMVRWDRVGVVSAIQSSLVEIVQEDSAPKCMTQKGCRVQLKTNRASQGTIARDNDGSNPLPVVWDGTTTISAADGQDIEVVS